MNGREPYLSAAKTLIRESGCVVTKWRTTNSGRARTRSDAWEIEVPEPIGPVAFSVLAHEVAHQLLHRTGSKSRWLEEVEAEEWALAQFERFSLPGVEQARARMRRHLLHSAAKALRRSHKRKTYLNLARRLDARMPEWVGFREWVNLSDEVFEDAA